MAGIPAMHRARQMLDTPMIWGHDMIDMRPMKLSVNSFTNTLFGNVSVNNINLCIVTIIIIIHQKIGIFSTLQISVFTYELCFFLFSVKLVAN